MFSPYEIIYQLLSPNLLQVTVWVVAINNIDIDMERIRDFGPSNSPSAKTVASSKLLCLFWILKRILNSKNTRIFISNDF